MRLSKGFAISLVVVAAAALASTALAAPWRVVGRGAASGDFTIAVASANTNRPLGLAVRIVAAPNQRASGTWTVVCSKGPTVRSRSGQFRLTTPVTRVVPLPVARPDSCIATGSAALVSAGTVRVEILRR